VLGRLSGEQLSAHQRIGEAVDPLHFGTFGGQITRLLWFVWGIMLCALSASGAWIYALRLSSRIPRRAGKPELSETELRPFNAVNAPQSFDRTALNWRQIWRGMTLRWAQAALVLGCLGLTVAAFWP